MQARICGAFMVDSELAYGFHLLCLGFQGKGSSTLSNDLKGIGSKDAPALAQRLLFKVQLITGFITELKSARFGEAVEFQNVISALDVFKVVAAMLLHVSMWLASAIMLTF